MAAVLVRSFQDPRFNRITHIYQCSDCGAEIELYKKIPGRNTYCGKCTVRRSREKREAQICALTQIKLKEILTPYLDVLRGVRGNPEEAAEQIDALIKDIESRIGE